MKRKKSANIKGFCYSLWWRSCLDSSLGTVVPKGFLSESAYFLSPIGLKVTQQRPIERGYPH